MFELPTEKIIASEINPKFLILYGKPKSGKTSILTGLDKCLIIDLEGGTDYYDAMSVKAKTLNDLKQIYEALAKNPGYYNFIAIDTGTALEDMVMPRACAIYKNTPMGKNWSGKDIRELPQGAGYLYLRMAFEEVIDLFLGVSKYFILTGHLKDKYVEKNGTETASFELDLTGRLKSIISAKSDAIGYLYRKGTGGRETWINFQANDNIICGARPNHLKNKEIMIAQSDEQGTMTYHWDKIYLPNN